MVVDAFITSADNFSCSLIQTILPAELKAVMKKNQNGVSHDSTGCGRDADPLASEMTNRDNSWNATQHRCSLVADDFINEIIDSTTKNNQNGTLCHLKGHGRDADPLSSESNDTAPLESSKVIVNFTSGDEDRNKYLAVKENQNGYFHHSNCCERNSDSFISETNSRDEILNASEHEHSMVVDEFTSTCENEMRDFFVPHSISLELLKKDMDLYTDKNVMECVLPELIVCYKESTFSTVKDICVDEGVPLKDKILMESSEDDQKGNCASILACNENGQSDIIKENVDEKLLVPDGNRHSSEKGCDMDAAKEYLTEEEDTDSFIQNNLQLSESVVKNAARECLADDPTHICEANCRPTDKIMDDSSSQHCASNRMLSVQDCDTQKSLELFFLEDSFAVEKQSGQISSAKAISEGGNLVVATGELNKNSPIDNLPYDSKVEGGNITSDLESSKSAVSNGDEAQGIALLRPLELQDVPRHGGVVFDAHSVSSQVQRGEGESSFSVAGPISGLISCSGPIAYSGSISLRSDSSTTSTRSFAFPVLQSEWNSSPVRMAKADRRHYQKHRGWMQGLLCCRF